MKKKKKFFNIIEDPSTPQRYQRENQEVINAIKGENYSEQDYSN